MVPHCLGLAKAEKPMPKVCIITMATEIPITERVSKIQRQLNSIISATESAVTPLIPSTDVVDVLQRFKLWVGDMGASHAADSAPSLEYRLREAPMILSEVGSLLGRLLEALCDGWYRKEYQW